MTRAILFDLDDTLMDHHAALAAGLDEWCAELGVPTGRHELFAEIERRWFAAYERGEVTYHGQRAQRCREFLGRELTDAEALALYDGYLAAYQRNWVAFDDALPALRAALGAGLKVGVLTNGDRQLQGAKLRAGGLDLPGVVLFPTADMVAPKPDARVYRQACAELGVAHGDALMVGDSLLNDVEGARAAGLRALHLDRAGGGDISSLAQLPLG